MGGEEKETNSAWANLLREADVATGLSRAIKRERSTTRKRNSRGKGTEAQGTLKSPVWLKMRVPGGLWREVRPRDLVVKAA